jgi:hypothetical protein
MTDYELMIKTNHYLIQGGELTEGQKNTIVKQFLASICTKQEAQRFYQGVRYPNNTDRTGRRLYPMFYIPPYHDGKKYKTILNQTPKTHILSANMYELEILRLLHYLSFENKTVDDLVATTLERLKTTCYGYHDDGLGECFDSSLVVLRFLAQVAPSETAWIQSRIDNYHNHVDEKKRPWYNEWYYWLCLSELPFELADSEIPRYKGSILEWLTEKSMVMNSEQDKTLHPVLFCILRNMMARYPEYEYIKAREPFVSEKDGRLRFNLTNLVC